jgi:hypothetical protein
MSELLMIEQRARHRDGAPWILEGGASCPGMDDRRGSPSCATASSATRGCGRDADAAATEVERTLARCTSRATWRR